MDFYLVEDRDDFDNITLREAYLDEFRKIAGVPEDTEGDDQRILNAIDAAGHDCNTLSSARDYLIDRYGDEMSAYIAEQIESVCPNYDADKDRETPHPLCAPWYWNDEWLTDEDFESRESLTSVLDALAEEAVEEFQALSGREG